MPSDNFINDALEHFAFKAREWASFNHTNQRQITASCFIIELIILVYFGLTLTEYGKRLSS